MPYLHFADALREAIAASEAPELPYATALLDDCQLGFYVVGNPMIGVLESIEYLADHCYMSPHGPCREVLDRAYAACDPHHNMVVPTHLSSRHSDTPIEGWVRHHAAIPYNLPVYLSPEVAACLSLPEGALSEPVEVITPEGPRRLVPLNDGAWEPCAAPESCLSDILF